MNEGASDFLIYYSGHGDIETGGWICHLDKACIDIEESYVTLEEVLAIFYKWKFEGNLEITSDSCYAGKIAFRAKKYWEDNKDEGIYLKGLKIACSCNRYKKSIWGKYRNMRKNCTKEFIT